MCEGREERSDGVRVKGRSEGVRGERTEDD